MVCENNKRNLLDFIDITLDKQGRVLVGWADGCVNRCVTEGHTKQSNTLFADRPEEDMALTRQEFDELYSQEDIGTITRQSCGLGLIADFDNAPDGPAQICAQGGKLPGGEVTPVLGTGTVVTGTLGTGGPLGAVPGSTGVVDAAPARSVALAATGASTALAIAGIVLLGVVAYTRRRGSRTDD